MQIKDYPVGTQTLSDEVYVINKEQEGLHNHYQKGGKVRLISGIDDSPIPGYHFNPKYKTVCSVDVEIAQFVGIETQDLTIAK